MVFRRWKSMGEIPPGGEPPGFHLLALVILIAVICGGFAWAWFQGRLSLL